MDGPPERLRAIRMSKGLTQQEMADSLGVTLSFYSFIEQGRRGFSKRILHQLKEVYDISSDYLLHGVGTPRPVMYVAPGTSAVHDPDAAYTPKPGTLEAHIAQVARDAVQKEMTANAEIKALWEEITRLRSLLEETLRRER
ncbi:MAG: helix-turn-helix transcriptional regulator [Bacteroidetes bacterium]|nr:helix-turn-helix transcriptional regulator [Bacteroidota bacterium]